MSVRVTCEVLVPDELVVGQYANAFRVLQAERGMYFLDFCVMVPSDRTARVVARVRVQSDMLRGILDRMQEDGLVPFPSGQVFH